MSNVYTQEALINLLDTKGIIKKEELLEEIERLRAPEKNHSRHYTKILQNSPYDLGIADTKMTCQTLKISA